VSTLKDKREKLPLINDKIRAESLQLIGSDGENIGVVTRQQALQQADEEGLDLVLIAESGKDGLPVAKVMDFGKVLYDKKKKKTEAKKHQKVIQVKEVKLSPKIGEHDYQTKMKQAMQFLKDGKRVKFTLFFRGREQATKDERGNELFGKIEKTFRDLGFTSDNMVQEADMKAGRLWSRIYYLKNSN
jgi:translation initiation factor IF-3